MAEPVLYAGYLNRLDGQGVTTRKWFVLRRGSLSYRDNEFDPTDRRSIDIRGAKVERISASSMGKPRIQIRPRAPAEGKLPLIYNVEAAK